MSEQSAPSFSIDDLSGYADMLNDNDIERAKTFEEVVAEVEAYFGGRVFTYKGYSGTAAQVASECPAIGMIVSQGAEAVIQFLEANDGVTEEEKLTKEDLQNEKSDADDEAPQDKLLDKNEATTDASDAFEQEETKVAKFVEREDHAVRESVSEAAEIVVDLRSGANDDSITPLLDSDVMKPVVKLEEIEGSDAVAPAEVKSDAKVEFEVEAQPEPSDVIPIELFQPERIVTPVVAMEQNVNVPVEKTEDVQRETIVESVGEVAPEIETIQQLPAFDTEYVVEESPFNAYIEPPEYVSRGSANELAEQPTVTDAFQIPNEHLLEEAPELFAEEQNSVIEVIDVLDETEAEILSPDEEPVLNHSAVEEVVSVEQSAADEASVLQQVVEHEQADTEEFEPDEAVEAVIDIIAKIEGEEPEYEAEVNAIEGGRYIKDVAKAVSQLETAQTREECQLYLAELRKSLSELFEALGYENAEAMAIRWITLVRQYGTETLKELIATLLQTLAQQNATHFAKTTGHAHKHHWFGQRVVERVVQAIPIVQVA